MVCSTYFALARGRRLFTPLLSLSPLLLFHSLNSIDWIVEIKWNPPNAVVIIQKVNFAMAKVWSSNRFDYDVVMTMAYRSIWDKMAEKGLI